MNVIKLHDKYFKPFLSHEKIQERISVLASKINTDFKASTPIFIGVLNGSFLFVADLLKNINIPCELTFIKVASYQGTETSGKVKQILGLSRSVEGRDIVILEDIVDTGITIEDIYNQIKKDNPKSIKIASLLFKPKAYNKSIPIDYVGLEVGNEFLVGYGLDYNELGRNLKDLYIITEKQKKMINLILFGPPGAGKGTQALNLKEEFNLVHLSTGDILRAERKAGTKLGKEADNYISKGELVPDEVVIGMIENKLEEHKNGNGFIFDGFPRTTAQAEALDTILNNRGWSISTVLSLQVDEDELVKRLLLRGKDSGRKDDQDEGVIRNRMSVYRNQTEPLKAFYDNQNKLVEIDGIGSIEDIGNRLKEAVQ